MKNLCEDDDDPVEEDDSLFEPLLVVVEDDEVVDVEVVRPPAEPKPELAEADIDRDNDGECELFAEESLIFCLLLGDEVGDANTPEVDNVVDDVDVSK